MCHFKNPIAGTWKLHKQIFFPSCNIFCTNFTPESCSKEIIIWSKKEYSKINKTIFGHLTLIINQMRSLILNFYSIVDVLFPLLINSKKLFNLRTLFLKIQTLMGLSHSKPELSYANQLILQSFYADLSATEQHLTNKLTNKQSSVSERSGHNPFTRESRSRSLHLDNYRET